MPSEQRYIRLADGVMVEVSFDTDDYDLQKHVNDDELQLVFDGPDGTASLIAHKGVPI
ncbi:hypothetical protein [Haloferax larsenii]|nr:hypothetical protein [Haloferax larsenii]